MSWNLGKWAEDNFGGCELGDIRRTRRVVRMAEQSISNPSGSLPEQMKTWGDLKAAYRLFGNRNVTAESIGSAHWLRTKSQASGHVLVICDTTEIDFGFCRNIAGTGPTGNGFGNGFLLHNALLVQAETKSVLGLGGQVIHTRPKKPRKDNASQKLKRQRESQIWTKAIDLVGPPRRGARYTVVGDRASDNYEVFLHLLTNKHGWILRAKSLNRMVFDSTGERVSVAKALSKLDLQGTYDLRIRKCKNRVARTASLEVLAGTIEIPPPHHKSQFVKQHAPQRILTNVIWVREKNPPKDVKPIQWVLYTSLPVETFDQSWKVLEGYEARWLIEEYHKALKSGCRLEGTRLQSADRLQPAAAFLSVVAVALLQLKSFSQSKPDLKARRIVPMLWLKMLKAVQPTLQRVHDITVRDFYRQVAKLGGFLGRKSDGEPGWITTWRGWEQLHLLVRGAQVLATLQKT